MAHFKAEWVKKAIFQQKYFIITDEAEADATNVALLLTIIID